MTSDAQALMPNAQNPDYVQSQQKASSSQVQETARPAARSEASRAASKGTGASTAPRQGSTQQPASTEISQERPKGHLPQVSTDQEPQEGPEYPPGFKPEMLTHAPCPCPIAHATKSKSSARKRGRKAKGGNCLTTYHSLQHEGQPAQQEQAVTSTKGREQPTGITVGVPSIQSFLQAAASGTQGDRSLPGSHTLTDSPSRHLSSTIHAQKAGHPVSSPTLQPAELRRTAHDYPANQQVTSQPTTSKCRKLPAWQSGTPGVNSWLAVAKNGKHKVAVNAAAGLQGVGLRNNGENILFPQCCSARAVALWPLP